MNTDKLFWKLNKSANIYSVNVHMLNFDET
jgi:hypothetical protein